MQILLSSLGCIRKGKEPALLFFESCRYVIRHQTYAFQGPRRVAAVLRKIVTFFFFRHRCEPRNANWWDRRLDTSSGQGKKGAMSFIRKHQTIRDVGEHIIIILSSSSHSVPYVAVLRATTRGYIVDPELVHVTVRVQ